MPRLLDLFCGAGGSAVGYHRAGFDEIVGVDIVPQKNYPFTFIQEDAFDYVYWWRARASRGMDQAFDLIHASPPCQVYSAITRDRTAHPDLISPIRELLNATRTPYVIENVERSPVMAHLKLCGSMFGLQVQRHRLFEISGFPVLSPGGCNHKAWPNGRPWSVMGKMDDNDALYRHSFKPSLKRARVLMDMPWVQTAHELAEAIPPAYTEYLGTQFLDQIARQG